MSNDTPQTVQWLPLHAAPGFSSSKVMVNGRTYWMQRRDMDGLVITVSKRVRSNSAGLHYQPMNIKLAAARKVLAALELKGGAL